MTECIGCRPHLRHTGPCGADMVSWPSGLPAPCTCRAITPVVVPGTLLLRRAPRRRGWVTVAGLLLAAFASATYLWGDETFEEALLTMLLCLALLVADG